MVDLAAQGLDVTAFGFAVHALGAGTFAGLGGASRFAGDRYAADERLQSVQRIFPVLFLSAKLLRLDHNQALLSHPQHRCPASARPQALVCYIAFLIW